MTSPDLSKFQELIKNVKPNHSAKLFNDENFYNVISVDFDEALIKLQYGRYSKWVRIESIEDFLPF